MSITMQNNTTALVAATSGALIQGDDGQYYRLFLKDDGSGLYVLSLEPYTGSLDGTRNFSGKVLGTAFYLTDPLGVIHRFNMVSDGEDTGTYGLQDAAQTSTYGGPVQYIVQNARFDNGVTMTDLDGASTHTLTVTGGSLTQSG